MNDNRLGYDPRRPQRGRAGGLFQQIIALTIGAVVLSFVLVVGLAMSIVVIPIVFVAALVGGGYLWFKTRTIRRELREQMQTLREQMQQPPGGAAGPAERGAQGTVIDGDEFIREAQVNDVQRDRPDR